MFDTLTDPFTKPLVGEKPAEKKDDPFARLTTERLRPSTVYETLISLFDQNKVDQIGESEGLVSPDDHMVPVRWCNEQYVVETKSIFFDEEYPRSVLSQDNKSVFLLRLGWYTKPEGSMSEPMLVLTGRRVMDVDNEERKRNLVTEGLVLGKDGSTYSYRSWYPSAYDKHQAVGKIQSWKKISEDSDELNELWRRVYVAKNRGEIKPESKLVIKLPVDRVLAVEHEV